MKGITRKEHRPTDFERICYGDDGEITEYDYLGSGDACEVKRDVDYEVSDSAREFIREVMSLDRRHLFDIIALANRVAGELHSDGIA